MVDRAYGRELPEEQRAAAPLAGGIARSGRQCGMVWGSALAAGAEAHRRLGACPAAEALAIGAARRITSAFRAQNGAVDCRDITGIDFDAKGQAWRFLVTGRAIACFRMAARFAPVAKAEIDAALAAGGPAPTEAPVSCASLVARRLGADERRAAMVAGFAGGIGLSGGGCGALGAAVWVGSLGAERDVTALEARARARVARFLGATGGRLACEEISGRRFESVADHAAFLRGGGCAEVLEALVSGP